MWVSIASDAACAAALQQALDDYGVVDTDALQAVLEIPETAAGLARSLCTALQAAPPVMVDASTMASAVASSDAGVSAVVGTRAMWAAWRLSLRLEHALLPRRFRHLRMCARVRRRHSAQLSRLEQGLRR